MRSFNSFRFSSISNSVALRVLVVLVLILSPVAVHYIHAAVKCTCVPGQAPQPTGSNNCIAGTGNCDVLVEWDAANTTSYAESNTDIPCQFRKRQCHKTPSIRTENSGVGTYIYCLGGSAACAACFAVAYAAELAAGAAGAVGGTSAGTAAGGVPGGVAGGVIGAGVAGGIAYGVLHGACGWLCSGVVWEPCCFVTCTPDDTLDFNSENDICY